MFLKSLQPEDALGELLQIVLPPHASPPMVKVQFSAFSASSSA